MNKLTRLFLITSLTIAATGCGQMHLAERRQENVSGQNAAIFGSEGLEGAIPGFTCPAEANINPEYDWYFDGTEKYSLCTADTSSYEIMIFGLPHEGTEISVFPIQKISETQVWWKYDQNGEPMVTKVPASQNGSKLTFSNTNFNAVFIVHASDQDQMKTCLKSGNKSDCPRYSFGKFR